MRALYRENRFVFSSSLLFLSLARIDRQIFVRQILVLDGIELA
jgi:hypothetical protein